MASTTNAIAVLDAVQRAVDGASGWRIVERDRSNRWIQAIPERLLAALPPICNRRDLPPAWLTLEFWIQPGGASLGCFWWSNPVTDEAIRNDVIAKLLNVEGTGVVYRSPSNWQSQRELALSGKTISSRWWPKGGGADLKSAELSARDILHEWSARVPAMLGALRDIASPLTNKVTARAVRERARPTKGEAEPTATAARPRQRGPARTTPAIPSEIRAFRAQPHYTSIFEIYPHEGRLYGTEDLYGDWSSPLLIMAKDAGSSGNFLPASKGGKGWAWVHNPARPTNRNLKPLADSLPIPKLYASFLGPLLRNDDRESGDLYLDESIRSFVRRLFYWTVAQMDAVETVAVLGKESWTELMLAIGRTRESAAWKSFHLRGNPLVVSIDGKSLEFVALNHPARITADVLARQPGWRHIVTRYA